jgi:hypothetical protein
VIALKIKDELLQLREKDGLIRPSKAVSWARNHPESELHKRIEWDDRKAAHEHRLEQVRKLIRVFVIYDDKPERATISLSSDRSSKDGGYRDADVVLNTRQFRDIAIRDALTDVKRWRERHRALTELSPIFRAVDLFLAAESLAEAAD